MRCIMSVSYTHRIGCEVYVSPRKHTDKIHEFESENRHLVLLCKNNTGYQNLAAMVSEAWINGFYNKPRVCLLYTSVYGKMLKNMTSSKCQKECGG